MIIDNEILEIIKKTGIYRFRDKDGNLYVIIQIDENGQIREKNPNS